ncbi:MAG: formylglycine-generating enzyme family protein [Thermodesulfobacteriota bacterium]|nr:formylglycine-generating enzyme family protein [Thermodesulfobacteriota bacterium]
MNGNLVFFKSLKYVCLLATSIQSEITSKAKDTRISNKPLPEEMRDRMIKIPAGEFKMGDNDTGLVDVKISRSFMMDKYPVTQALYQKVMNNNPSRFKGEDRPVESVSWFDVIEFCNELSRRIGLHEAYEVNGEEVKRRPEANGYRLPTEAEWEYACRANTTGDHFGNLDEIAWYDKNSGGQPQGVGQKKANDFGLYDMLGNVWEWCNDWYGKYLNGPVSDPAGAENGSGRVVRGGAVGTAGPGACGLRIVTGFRPATVATAWASGLSCPQVSRQAGGPGQVCFAWNGARRLWQP